MFPMLIPNDPKASRMLELLYLIGVGIVVGLVLDRGVRKEIPASVFMISVLVLGVARILLGDSRVALLTIGAAQGVVALGCGIAELAAGRVKAGLCLLVIFLCCLSWLATNRRGSSGPA